jgi:hypothetical protein
MKNLFYLGLEPLKARYTYQLSKEWMPAAFAKYQDKLNFIDVEGEFDPDQQIKVGAVLDAVGRGKFAMSQCSNLLDMINNGDVKNGDVIYIQDFWHPGFGGVLYALDLYGIKVDIYARIWAQSVDEYDFTWPMRDWMRGYELGLEKRLTGIFVGSTVHRDQLRQAGFTSAIHVTSLPLDKNATIDKLPNYASYDKKNTVVYVSRLDKEKNPYFMFETAREFLKQNPDWEWKITTSGKEFKSMLPGVIDDMRQLAKEEPRFKLLENLTKEEYYEELAQAKIQFNSSLQDYVSWTILESMTFGCTPVFPNFRSFTEMLNEKNMYKAFDLHDAIQVLNYAKETEYVGKDLPTLSDIGRQMDAYIMANGIDSEINVWHEYEYCKQLITKENNG